MTKKNEKYPVLPLRDIVVYPKMIVPLFVGRDKSIRALQEVVNGDQNIVLESRSLLGSIIRNTVIRLDKIQGFQLLLLLRKYPIQI